MSSVPDEPGGNIADSIEAPPVVVWVSWDRDEWCFESKGRRWGFTPGGRRVERDCEEVSFIAVERCGVIGGEAATVESRVPTWSRPVGESRLELFRGIFGGRALLRVLSRVGLELAFEAIRLGNSIPPGVSIVGSVGGNCDI